MTLPEQHDDGHVVVNVTKIEAPPEWCSLKKHAHLFGYDVPRLRKRLGEWGVPCITEGKDLKFARADILAAMAKNAKPLPKREPKTTTDERLAALQRAGIRVLPAKAAGGGR